MKVQKEQITSIVAKYTQFIEKLMDNKKELSLKCEHQSKKLFEKNQELKALEDELIKRTNIRVFDNEKEIDKNKTQEFKMKIEELQKQNSSYKESKKIEKKKKIYFIF